MNSTFGTTPKNAVGGSNVYKTTFTVDGAAADTDMSGKLLIRDLNDNAYGMSGFKTLGTNKAYAYLSKGTASAAYDSKNYATVANWLNGATVFSGRETMGTSNVTLSAKWNANNYTVVFDANGGTVDVRR